MNPIKRSHITVESHIFKEHNHEEICIQIVQSFIVS